MQLNVFSNLLKFLLLSCKAFFLFIKSSVLFISLHNLGPTVVTDAKHMSGAWTSGGFQPAQPGTRVADSIIKAGGESYNGAFNNCQYASRRMMNVGKGLRRPRETEMFFTSDLRPISDAHIMHNKL